MCTWVELDMVACQVIEGEGDQSNSAFLGGSILGSLSHTPSWLTAATYAEEGPRCVHAAFY